MTRVKTQSKNRVNLGLVIALCIVSALLIVSATLWITNMSKVNNMGLTIENVYDRNFYDLVDNVNNSEIKLSKVLASSYDNYSRKLLGEISKNTNSASYNLSNLPISLNGIDQTKKFINQVSGYTEVMASKLEKGENLSNEEITTLENLRDSFTELKTKINELSKDIYSNNIFNQTKLISIIFNQENSQNQQLIWFYD